MNVLNRSVLQDDSVIEDAFGFLLTRCLDSFAQVVTKRTFLASGGGGLGLYCCSMAVMVEMIHTGCAPEVRAEVGTLIEHSLSDCLGDWRVLIIGSQANQRWEMKITGPNAFERSYTLEGSAGQHEPHAIGDIVRRIVSVLR